MRWTDWDHNGWYHRLLLAQVPPDATRVLDVGCGAGTLARRLAFRARHVDGVDRSPAMIAAAGEAAPPNLTLHRADLRTVDLPAGRYDAVMSSAVLHHLPLPDVLPRMARWVRPGGVLAAVALPRADLPPPREQLPSSRSACPTESATTPAPSAPRPRTHRRRPGIRQPAPPRAGPCGRPAP
ncbi:Methyltransferase domain-containing protein [Geodermatophilus obscurus]|uniref:Methyltransferase domain-containing protein n=1 Tax=Geodermatophilus obscurus TaxID=1861 RepID=A0A1M7S1I3_9ACTN|nr:class I SAM-dependent methyltransferase [Geodermatophilus obscurus]SHN52321.1 Methyltransferase domain-containing protein [Geodermatophilus obscurus]